MELKKIEAEIDRANADLNVITGERDKAFREARAKIDAEFKDRLDAASRRKSAAERARRDHIEANAGHPWEGRKVVRTERKPVSRWSRTFHDVDVYGVVEVRRQGSQMPENKTWGLPRLGESFVRRCKANGEVGKTIDRHGPDAKKPFDTDDASSLVWKLVDSDSDQSPSGESSEAD